MILHSYLPRFSNHDNESVKTVSFKIKLCFVSNDDDDDDNEDNDDGDDNEDDDDDQATW